MAITFRKLTKMFDDKGITTYYLRINKIIGTETYYKLKSGEGSIDTRTINKLCGLLNCQPGDIMEFIPDTNTETGE